MTVAGSIPAGYTAVGPCVCFEVKPKAGFMPAPTAAVPAGSIKRRYPRFVMHQLLKHLKVGHRSVQDVDVLHDIGRYVGC